MLNGIGVRRKKKKKRGWTSQLQLQRFRTNNLKNRDGVDTAAASALLASAPASAATARTSDRTWRMDGAECPSEGAGRQESTPCDEQREVGDEHERSEKSVFI